MKLKPFPTDWDLNPCAGIWIQPKSSLALKPMWLGLKPSQTLAWDSNAATLHWDLNPHGWDSVQFSWSVMSNSFWPHESQHARPPCPSPTPGVYSNSCPSSQGCHLAISYSVIPFLLLPPIPPSIRVFSNESTFHMRWPKHWSFCFSISPSNERPGLISFRMD